MMWQFPNMILFLPSSSRKTAPCQSTTQSPSFLDRALAVSSSTYCTYLPRTSCVIYKDCPFNLHSFYHRLQFHHGSEDSHSYQARA